METYKRRSFLEMIKDPMFWIPTGLGVVCMISVEMAGHYDAQVRRGLGSSVGSIEFRGTEQEVREEINTFLKSPPDPRWVAPEKIVRLYNTKDGVVGRVIVIPKIGEPIE